jgi:hypothetical protein
MPAFDPGVLLNGFLRDLADSLRRAGARRALKRRLTDAVYRSIVKDQQRLDGDLTDRGATAGARTRRRPRGSAGVEQERGRGLQRVSGRFTARLDDVQDVPEILTAQRRFV